MSHEIESEFTLSWGNEATQCRCCTSYREEDGRTYCTEGNFEVPPDAHCDFFQSID